MICMKCGKVLNFEKIITPEGKAYHVKCFDGAKKNDGWETTYETQTRFVECAKCKRITSEGHAEQFLDIWICCWCGQ